MLRSVYHVSHVFEDTLLFIQCGLLWPLLLCVDNMMQKFLTATVKCSKCINVRLEFVATTVYPPSKFSSVETCCAHSLKCTLEETKLIRGTSPITFLLLIFCYIMMSVNVMRVLNTQAMYLRNSIFSGEYPNNSKSFLKYKRNSHQCIQANLQNIFPPEFEIAKFLGWKKSPRQSRGDFIQHQKHWNLKFRGGRGPRGGI